MRPAIFMAYDESLFEHPPVGSLVDPLTGRRWEPPEIHRQVAGRRARYDALGVGAGHRVFLHHGNTIEFFADLLAVWRLGACAVPLDPSLTPFEVETLARAASPRLSLWCGGADGEIAARLAALGAIVVERVEQGTAVARGPRRSPTPPAAFDRDALILFTSGTTGRPKGVVHTRQSLLARWRGLAGHLGSAAFRRTLCLLPTHFGHGLICNCLFPWLGGHELLVLPPSRPDLLMALGTIIEAHRVTALSSVPAHWRLILRAARRPRAGCLERVFCGSAPLSASLWAGAQEWAGTRDVVNAYGMTETGSWVAGATGADVTPEDGLVGTAWGATIKVLRTGDAAAPPGVGEECRPGEAGHVWVKTPALMRGYLDADDETRAVVSRGWFSTGDVGVMDDRALLYLRGREREVINKGGMKIYPADIDAVIERFAATVDVCTFGYEDPLQGEDVGVAVVLRPDDGGTRRALSDWARRHLAQPRIPRRWYLVDAIPRTARGKIDRSAVAERCARLRAADFWIDPPAAGGVG
jgi:acyl-CoA synthetase (AMP-forming)/AMP-acid ligase II